MLMEPLPSVNRAFSMMLQQERQVASAPLAISSQPENMAFLARSCENYAPRPTAQFKLKGKKPICSYCGYVGHTAEVCYKKNGYPPGYKSRPRVQPQAHCVSSYDDRSQLGPPVVPAAPSDAPVTLSRSDWTQFQQRYNQMAHLVNQPQAHKVQTQPSTHVVQPQTQSQMVLRPPSPYASPQPDVVEPISDSVHTVRVNSAVTDQAGPSGKCTTLACTHLLSPWVLDTGATDLIVCDKAFFTDFETITGVSVQLPNGSKMAIGKGTVIYSSTLILTNALYAPDFTFNLVSISQLVRYQSVAILFSHDHCLIQEHPSLKTIGSAKLRNGLYVLSLPSSVDCVVATSQTTQAGTFSALEYNCKQHDFNIWHYSLGHMSLPRMQYLQSVIPGIAINKNSHCSICPCAKQKRLSFLISSSVSTRAFALIHVDIWGHASTVSITGHKFFLTIVDDYTRTTWVHLLTAKSEARAYLISFCEMVCTQFESSVQVVRSDNGREFLIPDFYASKGIIHQTSFPYTSQQNGIVERKHQHILSITRALLFQAFLPPQFWSFAVQHSVHLINRTPTRVLQNRTPYELLHEVIPYYNRHRVFGCLCYATYTGPHQSKLASRAVPCLYLGNAVNTKGYRLFNLATEAVLTSRDVVF
ncbi:Retrovirus-related Pol polyprotein from transposon RE1 [Linum perenne]